MPPEVNMREVDACMENVPKCLENREADKNLDILENKTKLHSILDTTRLKMPTFKVEIETDKDKYNFKINGRRLNIISNINQLKELGKVLPELFNKDIQLFGYAHNRTIAKDSFMLDGMEDHYIDSSKSSLSKNDIEELFIFVMKVKGIPMEEWKVESTICAHSEVNQACKQALGNK